LDPVATPNARQRVCIIYDCLYPYTIGGAEKWYRELASSFVSQGDEVVYLTRKQWEEDAPPAIDGVEVVAVMGRAELYDSKGNRRIGETLRFGFGVFRHLLAHRRSYDVVHLCAFPYFSLIAARLALVGRSARVGVDWFEVWSASYWSDYLGSLPGRVGVAVQRACIRLTPLAFAYSELAADRLVRGGVRHPPVKLRGMHAGEIGPDEETGCRTGGGRVVWIGRLIPEKRSTLVPGVVARLRSTHPDLRATMIGAGPQTAQLRSAITEAGVDDMVSAPGFVERQVLEDALRNADCLLVTSVREGYGVVVLEAAARGTPVVVVEAEDNAAAELIEPGVNGYLVPSDDPQAIADAIRRVIDEGGGLRRTTREWFERSSGGPGSADVILATYAGSPPAAPRSAPGAARLRSARPPAPPAR
jgi:glycosyltransferase involved in cell wall biosynthesis